MEYFELLKKRHSVRKFTGEPVSDEQIECILKAANAAPVGSNLYKDIHLTVVKDRDLLYRFAEAARYRMKDKETMREITKTIPGQGTQKKEMDPFYGAPVVIFVSHRRQTLQPGIEYCNVASVVLAMHLAAADLGLGSVFMWGSMEAMRIYPQFDRTDLLKLPENFEPLLGIAIGYSAMEPKERDLTTEKIGINRI
ncbi:MAG: nitroreductase family protein [Oscillospiraceae bacterium]|nr:nitroreductase family protein [Oscillospiraceae bacterium]